eukprot:2524057-Rhodomonas_salina.1
MQTVGSGRGCVHVGQCGHARRMHEWMLGRLRCMPEQLVTEQASQHVCMRESECVSERERGESESQSE